MRWNDIHINAAAACMGRTVRTADAVADGRYDAEECERSGYRAVRVSDGAESAVDLAVTAGNRALERSGIASADFRLLLHASISHQGLDDFAPAPHVQGRTIRGNATAMEVRQASNGGMAALELAAAYLTVREAPDAVLLTTADRFVPPGWDRFRTAAGVLLGDAGTSIVLSRQPGVAKLLSSVSIGDTTYEGLQTGDARWTDVSGADGWPINSQDRVDAFVARHGADIFIELVQSLWRNETDGMERALADAGATTGDIATWVFPNMGEVLTDWDARKAFGVDLTRTTWAWGREQGHLGAGDQFATLAHLWETRQVRTGDLVFLNGAGTGFSFSSAVVEITGEPDWRSSTD
ncbi:MAG TPA: ketoacyl-ACP synthase III family protein [Pseudonocardiaceae bacterium]|nr:ketoacyl-ACP synthase III family protein [Pseudonocardiaceae bacterium]